MEYSIKKSTGILLEITSGNIKKKKSKAEGSAEGDKWELGVLKNPTTTI